MESFRNFVSESMLSGGSTAMPQASLEGGNLADTLSSYGQKVTALTNKVAQQAQSIVDVDNTKTFLMYFLIPAALFLILSPGVLLNIPYNSESHCGKLVPLPSNLGGVCVDGAYVGQESDPTDYDPICVARQKCRRFGASGYTSLFSSFVHAAVFAALLGGLFMVWSNE